MADKANANLPRSILGTAANSASTMPDPTITDADLFKAYQRAALEGKGISFERAKASPTILAGLCGTVKGWRKRQARQARQAKANPANYHVEKEVAA